MGPLLCVEEEAMKVDSGTILLLWILVSNCRRADAAQRCVGADWRNEVLRAQPGCLCELCDDPPPLCNVVPRSLRRRVGAGVRS
eukprot:2092601-Pyramimonas_sp.AAC.1